MAGVASTMRLSARLASKYAPACVARRGFRSSAYDKAAQNYTMPALSPTMTEGNIAGWKVKEGDQFSAGDVILEIETDKATMDVEAQDDGVLFKIMQPDGSKGVKVGERIAVVAEEGDDLGSLEIPADEKSASKNQEEKPAPKEEKKEPRESAEETTSSSKSNGNSKSSESKDTAATTQGGKSQKQTYPLFPSVQQLLHENGLSSEDANQIPASGPSGRLLKGDVLAYLGRISKDYPAQSSKRLSKLSHLDLSNIQLSKPAPKPDQSKESIEASELDEPQETELAVPISLSAVIATQKRVQDSLGIFLPLSIFIARASELANEDLPAKKTSQPTADDLFNSVLGLNQISKSSRGHFVPQVSALSPAPPLIAAGAPRPKHDIIDMLAPKQAKTKATKVIPAAIGVSAGENVFSVTAQMGDEARAAEYLERMKLALEKEPGRLVL